MNNKVKPSLWLLVIPIALLLLGGIISGVMMGKAFGSILDIETQNMGAEYSVTVDSMMPYSVYVELDEDQFVEDVFVNGDTVTVIVEDWDSNQETYTFEMTHYGTGVFEYEVEVPFGTQTLNDMTLVFTYYFDQDGEIGVVGNGPSSEFTIDTIDLSGMFGSIFGSVFVFIIFGLIALIITIVIFVKRSSNKKAMSTQNYDEPSPNNPFN